MNKKREFQIKENLKKGQMTLFVIIGIVIVVAAVLIYLFFPQIKSSLGFGSENPDAFMKNCLEKELNSKIELITSQGGSLNPEHYYMFKGEKIEYLCYTAEDYATCVMQQPMLKQHIEEEVKQAISSEVGTCLNELRSSFSSKGYDVKSSGNNYFVEIFPKKIAVTFNTSLVLIGDNTKAYNNINIILDNNLFELISIANSIQNWEARYGDAETTIYMNYYHDTKVEKQVQIDGTTIYTLTNRETGEQLKFASRSGVIPA